MAVTLLSLSYYISSRNTTKQKNTKIVQFTFHVDIDFLVFKRLSGFYNNSKRKGTQEIVVILTKLHFFLLHTQ
jgi:hypothetical protein